MFELSKIARRSGAKNAAIRIAGGIAGISMIAQRLSGARALLDLIVAERQAWRLGNLWTSAARWYGP